MTLRCRGVGVMDGGHGKPEWCGRADTPAVSGSPTLTAWIQHAQSCCCSRRLPAYLCCRPSRCVESNRFDL